MRQRLLRRTGQHVNLREHPLQPTPQLLATDARVRVLNRRHLRAPRQPGPKPVAIIVRPLRIERRMRMQRLDRAQRRPVSHVVAEVRQLHPHDLRAQTSQHLHRRSHRPRDLRRHIVRRIPLVKPDPHPPNAALDPFQHRRCRLGQRRRIIRIAARHRLQHHRAIPARPAHRTHMIQRLRQIEHPVSAHPSPRRLQPHNPAARRRTPNRSARVRTQRRVTQPRSRRHARSARRHPRPTIRRPRIHRHLPRPVVARHRALRQVQLAQQHRARLAQPRHHRRVKLRRKILQHLRAAHRRHPGCVAQILHRNRNPMQRTTHIARRNLRSRTPCLCQRCVRHHRRIALQRTIQSVDPRQLRRSQIDRRQLARRNPRRKRFNRGVGKIGSVSHRERPFHWETVAGRLEPPNHDVAKRPQHANLHSPPARTRLTTFATNHAVAAHNCSQSPPDSSP